MFRFTFPSVFRAIPTTPCNPVSRELGWVFGVTLLALLLVGFPMVHRQAALTPIIPSWVAGDVDTGLIAEGLRRAPTFRETLRWWTGPWVGIVPFYRPLTSYLFWFEWNAFGDREALYLYPTFALHAAATLLFAGFCWRLSRDSRDGWPLAAGVLAGLWLGAIALATRVPSAVTVAMQWKNQPDAAATCLVIASLWFYVEAIEDRKGALWGALTCYLLACGFKEIAVPLPVVCVLMEPDLRIWRSTAWRRVAAMGAIGVLFLAIRQLAIGGIGYTYGTNYAAVPRTIGAALGPFRSLALGEWLAAASVLLTCAFVVPFLFPSMRAAAAKRLRSSRHPVVGCAGCLSVLLVSIGLAGILDLIQQEILTPAALWEPNSWAVGIARALTSILSNDGPAMFAAVGTLVLLLIRDRRMLRIGLGWGLVFLLPLTLSPGPLHRYYLPDAGYALLGVFALSWLLSGRNGTLMGRTQKANTREASL